MARRIKVSEVRRWLKQAQLALAWARARRLEMPWANELARLAAYILRSHRRRRRHHGGRVASIGLTATAVEKGRSHIMGNPASLGITLAQNVQFNTTPKDVDGNAVTGAVITWASSDTTVLTVHESNALFLNQFPPTQAALGQSIANGTAVVTATCGAVSDSITVVVADAPPPAEVASLGLTATAVDK